MIYIHQVWDGSKMHYVIGEDGEEVERESTKIGSIVSRKCSGNELGSVVLVGMNETEPVLP